MELIETFIPLYSRNILQEENTTMQTIQRHIIHQAQRRAAKQAVIFAEAIFIDARQEDQDDCMFEMHLI